MKENIYSIPKSLNNNDIQNYSKRHISSKGESNGFFIQRNLKVKELKKYPLEITVYQEDNNTNREKFKGYLWNIEIQNSKFIVSKFVRNCSLELYSYELDKTLILLWKPKTIPDSYSTVANITENHREEYRKRLGHDYTRELVDKSNKAKDIPEGNTEELLFLFTSNELDKAVLVTSSGSIMFNNEINLFVNRIDENSLILPIPSVSKITFRFLNPIKKESNFQLNIKTFDDMVLTPL